MPSPVLIPVSRQEKPLSTPPLAPVQSSEMKLIPATPATSVAHPSMVANLSGASATSSSAPIQLSTSTNAVAPTSAPVADTPRSTIPKVDLAAQPGVHIEPSKSGGSSSVSEKFLEVGRFNNKLWVDKTTGRLSQFGFPVSVVQKNHLWKKSYQVLVGPYGTDQEAQAVHTDLTSHGFAPRVFERGSREFKLSRTLRLGNTNTPVGDCIVSWESYIPDAIVKFQNNKGEEVTADGKWVDRGAKYGENAVVYTTDRDGSRTLTEIRFSGMGRALIFARGSL